MKAKPVLPLFWALLLFIFLCSCQMNFVGSPQEPDSNAVKDVPPRQFWAFNYRTSQYYQTTANLYADGKYCRIWVEQGTNVYSDLAKKIANTFDTEIYPKMMLVFSVYGEMTIDGEIVANDTMQLADWLGDGDGKLTILFLDIQDHYQPGINEYRTAGYFSSSDLMANRPYSNKADMLYIDTNPEMPGSLESNKTIAHEMQHLMNFVSSFLLRRDSTIHEMDTWINEGLSAMAEWVYSGRHSENRWVYFNADPSELIQKGNNFFIWGNRTNEHQYAELDDYATVYLFFHWLRLQSDGNRIFTYLISSSEYSYRAVTQAASSAIKGAGYEDWATLLKTWLAANYINAPEGPYGYRNDRTLKNVKARTAPEGMQSVRLFPGEAVYSITNAEFPWPGERNNIKYAGLIDSPPWLDDKATYSGGALLTYNANPNEYGNSEEGVVSGIASNIVTTGYEQRIRALLSQRAVIDLSSQLGSNPRDETPDPAMTGAAAIGSIKLE